MSVLVDVVNFNADASCLAMDGWLSHLSGGMESTFCRWLSAYVDNGKKVVLGLTGATTADLAAWNPEALRLINDHPGIFEIILRPFAHDAALLRTTAGFAANVRSGRQVLQKTFPRLRSYFLPPEFMLTNQQVGWLADEGVKAVFINSNRFGPELAARIPSEPYSLKGLSGRRMPCIPLDGSMTADYLHAIQMYDNGPWNRRFAKRKNVFTWRDGESPFLIPDGVEREAYWLRKESKAVKRRHLSDLELDFPESGGRMLASYPVHSFLSWVREFRMLGFLTRVQRAEERLSYVDPVAMTAWFMAIGSDILSSVEKSSPVVPVKDKPGGKRRRIPIDRCERWVEGEEYLVALESLLEGRLLPSDWAASQAPHVTRFHKRLEFLRACAESEALRYRTWNS